MRSQEEFLGSKFNWFIGVVEDRFDPLRIGRVRLRVHGWHSDDKIKLPTSKLPWVQPILSSSSASTSGVGESPNGMLHGTVVFGFFTDDAKQSAFILGTFVGIPLEMSSGQAFQDPNGEYPKYIEEPDTNRLARHESITETVVYEKEQSKTTGVAIANSSDTWDQPDIPYNASYPYNKVIESESGHLTEIDDTPGCERTHQYHKSGTYTEIDSNGTEVHKIVGDGYTVYARNDNILVEGTVNLTIGGNANVYVGNDCELQVDGNLNSTIGQSVNFDVADTFGVTCDTFAVKSKSHKTESESIDVSTATLKQTVTGEFHQDYQDVHYYLHGDTFSRHDYGVDHSCPDDPPRDSEISCNEIDTAETSGLSGNNSGASPTMPTFPVLETLTRGENEAQTSDDVYAGNVTDARISQLVSSGVVTTASYSDVAIPSFTADTASYTAVSGSVDGNDKYKFTTEYPDSLQLSDNVTLGMVSTKAVVSHYAIQTQHSLTKSDICNNLRYLSENVLDPILSNYDNVLITSGFRVGSSGSQHEKGMAVDLQRSDLTTRAEYTAWARELRALVPFDQLLVEHKSYGTGRSWIHISFNPKANRQQVLTLFNDRTVSSGIVDIA